MPTASALGVVLWLTTSVTSGTWSLQSPPSSPSTQQADSAGQKGPTVPDTQRVRIPKRITPDRSVQDSAGSEKAAGIQLEIGSFYNREGRLDEAEKAYLQALQSPSETIRRAAFDSLRLIVAKRESKLNRYLGSPWRSAANTSVTTLLVATISFIILGAVFLALKWPVGWVGAKRGAYQLGVSSLRKADYDHIGFVSVLDATRAEMIPHFRPLGTIASQTDLPAIAESQKSELIALAEAAGPGGLGKLVEWVLGRLSHPEYVVREAVGTYGSERALIISLERKGEVLGHWEESVDVTSFFQRQRDVAFQVIIAVINSRR